MPLACESGRYPRKRTPDSTHRSTIVQRKVCLEAPQSRSAYDFLMMPSAMFARHLGIAREFHREGSPTLGCRAQGRSNSRTFPRGAPTHARFCQPGSRPCRRSGPAADSSRRRHRPYSPPGSRPRRPSNGSSSTGSARRAPSRIAMAPAILNAISLESTSWKDPSCNVARTLISGYPAITPLSICSSSPFPTAGMYSRGTTPPTMASTNSKLGASSSP